MIDKHWKILLFFGKTHACKHFFYYFIGNDLSTVYKIYAEMNSSLTVYWVPFPYRVIYLSDSIKLLGCHSWLRRRSYLYIFSILVVQE